MSITDILNTGLALMGWLFIMFRTGQWFISVALRQWDKRRKQSRRQKAVNEFYDAFDLSSIEPGTTVRLATKGDLTIMMFRQEAAQ
ncbi:DUF4752 domain-containing protein [Salmonella enterica subsp. diarizonae]|uniref:DUF4752 domain-containing protein n=1 Tax=Salmonella diarizonae TaxID=59204 RepID=A0A5Y3W029_SALDZ|nr:DUF4752 family protein [Salmonella enterica]EAA6549444.1 DUF4752 family protein [Salmonella enterica subsp. diarizonae]EAB9380330.1 DUF4752 family protein [Salmonella enterica subsp. enterica serovar Give]EBF9704230.1 DUF4752 family protein [Salmonella enterica subsp. enterica serovar Agona]EBG8319694.1 DUF4752 family protein [Salmonella enterica subsp. enterica serovar Weltevreden]EBX6619380.1 DUF4752 family protein [Salmonella enterica subsp. enterica serovar Newport]ECA1746896.1 DUF4752